MEDLFYLKVNQHFYLQWDCNCIIFQTPIPQRVIETKTSEYEIQVIRSIWYYKLRNGSDIYLLATKVIVLGQTFKM